MSLLAPVGLGLIVVGAIALCLAWLGLTGTLSRRSVGTAAIFLVAVGVFFGGLNIFFPGPPSICEACPPPTSALWDARITNAETGQSGVMIQDSLDGQRVDFYGTKVELSKVTVIRVTIALVNLNYGGTGLTWQAVMTYGSYDTILDQRTGQTYPIVKNSFFDQSIADITWVDGSMSGAQAGKLFYDNIGTSSTDTETVSISMNTSAWSYAAIGLQYTINLLAVGVTFPLGFHVVG